MSTNPTYKKIRDLNPKETPDSGDELAVSDKNTLSTNRISINNLVKAAFSHDNSVFETDANGNLTLKLGAIDGSKITPGTIESQQLAPGSITGDIIAPEAIQQHLTSNKTSNPTLADNTGVVRNIGEGYYGVITLLVNSRTDGIAYSNDHVDGPNPREFDGSNIDNNIIYIPDHGLFQGSKLSISSSGSSSFPESSPILERQDLYVLIIDENSFSVTSSPAGSSINLGPGWTGKFYLNREVVVSMDISDWVTTNPGPSYAPTINYNFSTMQAAYSWCARNADITYINFCFAHHSNKFANWNAPGSGYSRMDVDGQFNRPKVMHFYGNRNDGSDKRDGWISSGNATTKSNYHAYNRCVLKVYCNSNTNSIPIWVRGTSRFSVHSIWFEFDYQGTPRLNNLFNIGGSISSWHNASCDVVNAGAGSVLVFNSGEGNTLFMHQGTCYFGGLGSHNFIVVSLHSHTNVGAPNHDLYITTESTSGNFAKRKYNANQVTSIYVGHFINNSTGRATGGGSQLLNENSDAF